jgi:protein-S-isoprenylcysteine O-methyltransferase Ste14
MKNSRRSGFSREKEKPMKHIVGYRPPRIAMSLVLIAAVAHFTIGVPLHDGKPVVAMIVASLGFALMIRAWWLFRIAGTAICPTASASQLITHDVFAVSRNPMYLGITMMLAGLALWTGTLPFYIAAVGYLAVMDRVFCPYEEGKSAQEFGKDYGSYLRHVRRWL